jgi:hypothetical protein
LRASARDYGAPPILRTSLNLQRFTHFLLRHTGLARLAATYFNTQLHTYTVTPAPMNSFKTAAKSIV